MDSKLCSPNSPPQRQQIKASPSFFTNIHKLHIPGHQPSKGPGTDLHDAVFPIYVSSFSYYLLPRPLGPDLPKPKPFHELYLCWHTHVVYPAMPPHPSGSGTDASSSRLGPASQSLNSQRYLETHHRGSCRLEHVPLQ